MKKQNCNVISCEHAKWADKLHHVRTSTKHVFMCDQCYSDLLAMLGDKDFLGSMMKSTMTTEEVQRMRDERYNMRIERELEATVMAAFAVAGYPKMLALPEVVVLPKTTQKKNGVRLGA